MQTQQEHWNCVFFLTLASILPTIAHMLTIYQWDLFYCNIWTPPINSLWTKLSLYYMHLYAWVSKTVTVVPFLTQENMEGSGSSHLLLRKTRAEVSQPSDCNLMTLSHLTKTFSPCSTCINALDICHTPQRFGGLWTTLLSDLKIKWYFFAPY